MDNNWFSLEACEISAFLLPGTGICLVKQEIFYGVLCSPGGFLSTKSDRIF